MTRRERAQVVELLQCAADTMQREDLVRGGAFLAPIWMAALHIYGEPRNRIYQLALDAREQLFGAIEDQATRYLEAAARVEEGSWP